MVLTLFIVEGGAAQPREEKVAWTPHCNLPVSEGSLPGIQRRNLYQELQ